MSAEERVARLRRARRERLLGLLPRIYAAQPADSVVGALLDALAGRLAELDEAIERVLRDRWIALAGGDPRWDSGTHPVELLGHLADVWREPWEEIEAHRRRVRWTVPVLATGSTSPRGVLTLAAAALDTELCQRTLRDRDTTLGWGVRPGTVAFCAGCRSADAGACQYEDPTLADKARRPILARFALIDNPVTARSLELQDIATSQRFFAKNPSLAGDRPIITLTAKKALNYPIVHNLDSREVTLFAGALAPGETLTIRPARVELEGEVDPFESFERVGPAVALELEPTGDANVVSGDTTRDVSDKIFYIRGETFDKAHFASEDGKGPCFARIEKRIRTPWLEPGETSWALDAYSKVDVEALAQKGLLEELVEDAPEEPVVGSADVTLAWWIRPPATFRLSVPFMPEVRISEHRDDIVALLQRSVDRARAAGVRAFVDLPEPSHHDEARVSEGAIAVSLRADAREEAGAVERAMAVQARAGAREEHALREERPAFRGIFDVTRFDWTRLG